MESPKKERYEVVSNEAADGSWIVWDNETDSVMVRYTNPTTAKSMAEDYASVHNAEWGDDNNYFN